MRGQLGSILTPDDAPGIPDCDGALAQAYGHVILLAGDDFALLGPAAHGHLDDVTRPDSIEIGRVFLPAAYSLHAVSH